MGAFDGSFPLGQLVVAFYEPAKSFYWPPLLSGDSPISDAVSRSSLQLSWANLTSAQRGHLIRFNGSLVDHPAG